MGPPLTIFLPAANQAKAVSIRLFFYNLLRRWASIFFVLSSWNYFPYSSVKISDMSLADLYITESSKLNGENYVNWKFKIIIVLEALDLWPIVTRDQQKPADPLSIVDWNMQEVQGKVLIRISVKDNIIPHIRNCKTSKETWDKLKGLYEMSDSNRILFLNTKLLSIKMNVNESMNKYLSCIKDFWDNLGDIGEEVSSTDMVSITLKGPFPD